MVTIQPLGQPFRSPDGSYIAVDYHFPIDFFPSLTAWQGKNFYDILPA